MQVITLNALWIGLSTLTSEYLGTIKSCEEKIHLIYGVRDRPLIIMAWGPAN